MTDKLLNIQVPTLLLSPLLLLLLAVVLYNNNHSLFPPHVSFHRGEKKTFPERQGCFSFLVSLCFFASEAEDLILEQSTAKSAVTMDVMS